jgi:hypothetical protein
MIFCRMTKTEVLQVIYLDDIGKSVPECLQVKVSPRELANIEYCIDQCLKRIELIALEKEACFDSDIVAEGQYCICLYHVNQRAVITIRGATIHLHFNALLELKNEINKLSLFNGQGEKSSVVGSIPTAPIRSRTQSCGAAL